MIFVLFIMNKLLIGFCFIFLFISDSFCQKCEDVVRLRCWYEQYGAMDTTNVRMKMKDIMLLDIGLNMSIYYSREQYSMDSLKNDQTFQTRVLQASRQQRMEVSLAEMQKLPRGSGTHDYTILKNCPKNQLTQIDRLAGDYFYYEEDGPVFEWELMEDTATVCGYLCQKARTIFRGRTYHAWYTPEIPISSGPWKFEGLPGLILRVDDSQSMFRFVCTHIMKPEEKMQMNSDKYYSREFRISKSRYNQEKQRYMDNPGQFMTGSSRGQQIGALIPAHHYQKRPFNPIELTEK